MIAPRHPPTDPKLYLPTTGIHVMLPFLPGERRLDLSGRKSSRDNNWGGCRLEGDGVRIPGRRN